MNGLLGKSGILREQRKHGFRRGYSALGAKILQIGRLAKITEGYSMRDLQELLGVASTTIARWERAGWMVRNANTRRFSEETVSLFMRKYPNEWYFKRVDEVWAKGLLFPAFSFADTSEPRGSPQTRTFSMSIERTDPADCGSLQVGD